MKTRYWLCIEHGERFVLEAPTIEKASEHAMGYGAEVICEVTNEISND